MKKVKQFIISLLVIFISLLFIDEGKTVLLICDNVQIRLNDDHIKELETPHQHNFSRYADDEKWTNLKSFELSFYPDKLFLFPFYLIKGTEDYKVLVWQPPKSA